MRFLGWNIYHFATFSRSAMFNTPRKSQRKTEQPDCSHYLRIDCEPQECLPLQGSPPCTVAAWYFEGIRPDTLHTCKYIHLVVPLQVNPGSKFLPRWPLRHDRCKIWCPSWCKPDKSFTTPHAKEHIGNFKKCTYLDADCTQTQLYCAKAYHSKFLWKFI